MHGLFISKGPKSGSQVAWDSHGHKFGTFMPWSPSMVLDMKALSTGNIKIPKATIIEPKHGEKSLKLDLNTQ